MVDKPYTKQVSEKERVGIDFLKRLASGDYLVSATYTVYDSNDADVTNTLTESGTEQISDDDGDGINEMASIRIKAGTDGSTYKLTILATTNDGDDIEEDLPITVRNT